MTPELTATTSPLVDNIVSELTGRIRSGQYADFAGLPSERDLVREFGVSRTIIRRALALLQQENLIVRSGRCRTFVGEGASRTVRPQQTRRKSVGVWLWPNGSDPGTSLVAQGILRSLDSDRYRIVIGHVAFDSWESVCRSEARFLNDIAADEDVAGVLLWYLGGKDNLPALSRLRATGLPIVFLDRLPPEGFEADCVGVDNVQAAEQAVSHLLGQGHRRIAHITNGDHASTVQDRMTGYRRALERAGIAFDPALLVQALEPSPREAAERHDLLLQSLIALPDPPTAVFAVNDELALRFIEALRRRGISCPEGMAVAGFDGNEVLRPGEPFLTSCRQPFEQMGARAADLLARRIEEGGTSHYQRVMLDAPLCIYGSTLSRCRDRN